jgi:hypothetical protein
MDSLFIIIAIVFVIISAVQTYRINEANKYINQLEQEVTLLKQSLKFKSMQED